MALKDWKLNKPATIKKYRHYKSWSNKELGDGTNDAVLFVDNKKKYFYIMYSTPMWHGRNETLLAKFKTKQQALKYAKSYMKKH